MTCEGLGYIGSPLQVTRHQMFPIGFTWSSMLNRNAFTIAQCRIYKSLSSTSRIPNGLPMLICSPVTEYLSGTWWQAFGGTKPLLAIWPDILLLFQEKQSRWLGFAQCNLSHEIYPEQGRLFTDHLTHIACTCITRT